ncbi:sigma-70 family RNA polymerase sigma factor [Patescibacteria group bacterium]|nr:sigma-70 family RNA polymerase sigma factor [Patescibacteria group bacterium]
MRAADPAILHKSSLHPRDFGALYDAYYGRVYGYFLNRVGYDHELAEDLAQDTFLRALKHFPAFREEGYLYITYLMTIAHNLLVNHYRRIKSVPWSHIEKEQMPEMADEKSDIKAYLEREDLVRAIEHLSPFERSVLGMAYIRGMHNKEIAQRIHRTVSGAKLLLFRIRNKIRQECGTMPQTKAKAKPKAQAGAHRNLRSSQVLT